MPPGRGLKNFPQGSALEKCVEKLCHELEKTQGGEKMNGDIVESLCETLRSAKAKDTISTTAVGGLLAALEDQDGVLCCSLDIKTFCAVLNTILQGEDCREGERTLVLLANELFQQDASGKVLIDIAKAVDVGHLIKYFVDSSRPTGIRRWVGIIMLQLLRGPEAVFEQFQHTPEDTRRSIGPSILSEGNEIHRLICGQFVRDLLNSDILPEELWPVGTNKKDYESFPTGSQSQSPWKSQFQHWVDSKWPDNPSQTPPQLLYYSYSIVTVPPRRLGSLGENIEMVLEDGYILLLKTSTEKDLDQILQVPCSSVCRVSVCDNSVTINGKQVHDVVIKIKHDQEICCYLNSRPITIQQLCLTTNSDINELMNDLQDQCPDAEFPEERIQVSQAEDDILVLGEGSSPEFESRDRPSEENEPQDLASDPSPSPSEDEESSTDFERYSSIQAQEKSQQNPNRKHAADNLNSLEHDGVANFSDSPEIPVDQGTSISSDEAIESDDDVSNSNDQALLLKQKGKTRSQVTHSMLANKESTRKNGKAVTPTATMRSDMSTNIPNTREAPLPDTQPSTSQVKQSRSNRNTDLNANKLPKTYLVKPKPPMAVLKGKVEPTKPTAPAKTATIAKDKEVSNQVIAPEGTTSIYDLPEIEDDRTAAKKASQNTKGTQNKVSGSQKKGKPSGKGRVRNAKTYQRTKPVRMEVEKPVIAKRGSQRVAASQAKVNMSKINVDEEDVEDDLSDVGNSGPAQPNVSRKRKTMEQPAEPDLSEVKSVSSIEPTLEENEEAFHVQQQGAQKLGLIVNNVPPEDPFDPEIPQNASPQDSKDQKHYSQEKSHGSSRKSAAMKFASQLDGLLSDDPEGAKKTTHTNTLRKSTYKKKQSLRAPPPKLGRLKQSISEGRSAVIEKQIPDELIQEAEGNSGQHSQNEDSKGSQLEKKNSSEPGAQGSKTMVPIIPCEMEVKENQNDGKTDGVEDVLETKLVVRTSEEEDMELHVTTQPDAVLGTSSHLLSRFTRISKQEVVQKPVITKAIASDIYQPGPESSPPQLPLPDVNVVEEKKRKIAIEDIVPSKRHRPIATEDLDDPTISRPGPHPQIETISRSPASNSRPLLDDQSIRKPKLIHFGSKSAQNQGSSSTSKPVRERNPGLPITTSSTAKEKEKPRDAAQNKRRYNQDDQDETLPVSQSPPRKRQSISPPDLAAPKVAPRLREDDSSFMAPVVFKSSSQASRVDEFGSPLAQHRTPSIGQILKTQKKAPAPGFCQLEPALYSQRNVPRISVESPEYDAKDEVFGPRVKVVSIAKARPAPPGESPVRYVPHTETQNGIYEAILTMENIQEEVALPDPFGEDLHRKSSGFTERLRARQPDSTRNPGGLNIRFSDADKTLVEEQQAAIGFSSSSEGTSNSSFRSDDSSDPPRQELSPNHRWSLAVRTHYRGYADTVHKIADEMVIRLANEEDASKLIVSQYNENATTMLENLSGERNNEKTSIRQHIGNKKQELIEKYSQANNVMTRTEKDMKNAPMSDFNKEWQERQEAILREIKAGSQISGS